MRIYIKQFQKSDIEDLKVLLFQLTTRVTNSDLKNLTNAQNCICRVAQDHKICRTIGFGALSVRTVPSKGLVGTVEDLVVDQVYRGRGVGTALIEDLLYFAKENAVKYVELTSNPKRKKARQLYQKLGFDIVDTNLFRKTI